MDLLYHKYLLLTTKFFLLIIPEKCAKITVIITKRTEIKKMEVYGVKPKPFTKDWWPYFWEYYKLHTISAVLAAILLIFAVSECKNQKNYDLQIDVITENAVSQESLDALLDIVRKNIDDVTENAENEAYISYLNMSENINPQITEVMYNKMIIEAGYTEAFIFLVSQKFADYLSNEGVFKPSSDWTEEDSYNGYCMSLKDCGILQNIGIDTSDLYLGIVELRERDGKSAREKNLPKQENGIKFAKFLL